MKNFSQIYKENYRSVQQFISKMVSDPEMVQELTQVVFVKAFEKMSLFDESKSSFKTWLCNIAKNTVLDESSRACNRLNVSMFKSISSSEDQSEEGVQICSTFESSETSNPEIITSSKETVKNVVKYLRSLPILKRRIGLYRFFYDKALNEISEELNIPLGTVKNYTKQIKESLQIELA